MLDTGVTVTLPTPTTLPTPSMTSTIPENYFSAEQVAGFRKEEKDKLYPELESQKEKVRAMEAQLAAFTAEREAAQRIAAEQVAAEAEANRLREEAELSAKDLVAKQRLEFQAQIDTVRAETAAQLKAAQDERDFATALVEKDRQFQALEAYKTRRIAEVGDDVAPIFTDLIRGNSEEEIEASISTFVAKTSDIMEAYAAQAPTPKPRGISPTGAGPNGPLDNDTNQKTFSLQDLRSMSNEEYAQYRVQLQQAVSPRRG